MTPTMSGALVRVVAPHFVAGLVLDMHSAKERVIRAAPILRWTEGSLWSSVTGHFVRRGWTWQLVRTPP